MQNSEVSNVQNVIIIEKANTKPSAGKMRSEKRKCSLFHKQKSYIEQLKLRKREEGFREIQNIDSLKFRGHQTMEESYDFKSKHLLCLLEHVNSVQKQCYLLKKSVLIL
jgi:hypothetical protein